MTIDKAAAGREGGISGSPFGKPRSLGELASDLDPESYKEWQSARRAMASAIWSGDAGLGATIEDSGPQLYRNQPSGAQKAQRRINDALAKLNAAVRGAIASLRYSTEGVGPPGTMSDVPRDNSHELVVDIEGGTLATAAGWIWKEVTLTRSAIAAKSQPDPRTQRRRGGRKPEQRNQMAEWLLARFPPDGKPPAMTKNAAVLAEMKAEGIGGSEPTLRRALIQLAGK